MVERIRKLCQLRGITVKALEDALSFGNGTIRKWDTSSPTIERVKKVAEYFNISVSELLGEETKDNNELTDYIDMLRTRPEIRALLDHCDNATKKQVEMNTRILDAMRKEPEYDD